jgi:ferric-dicitrate binding protein FerR (iron transport regulator)
MTTVDRDKKTHSYTVEELLQDSCFIASVTHPGEESETFGNKAPEDGMVDRQVYEIARYFICSVQMSPEPVLQSEIVGLWENIEIANKCNLQKSKAKFRFYLSAVAGIAVMLILALMLRHGVNFRPSESYGNMELIVPPGKRSTLTFAEGSRMWVNAGTRVVYPAVFDKRQRKIYVDGEVYLEVATDEDCPFVVKTKTLNVEALGTSFNVAAYESDSVRNIVLVSGAVRVHADSSHDVILAPNEMYSWSDGSAEVKPVDVANHIAWKSGVYQYQSESLEVILKRLSRYYGQEIICSPQAAYLKCSGKLDLKDDLQQVLEGISQTAPVICSNDGGKYIITNH